MQRYLLLFIVDLLCCSGGSGIVKITQMFKDSVSTSGHVSEFNRLKSALTNEI